MPSDPRDDSPMGILPVLVGAAAGAIGCLVYVWLAGVIIRAIGCP